MIMFYRDSIYAQSVTDAKKYVESIVSDKYYLERFLHDYDPYYNTYSVEELTFVSRMTHDKVTIFVPSPEQEQYYF